MKLGGYPFLSYVPNKHPIDYEAFIATMTHEEYQVWLYEGYDL